jgi:hypothetical protein
VVPRNVSSLTFKSVLCNTPYNSSPEWMLVSDDNFHLGLYNNRTRSQLFTGHVLYLASGRGIRSMESTEAVVAAALWEGGWHTVTSPVATLSTIHISASGLYPIQCVFCWEWPSWKHGQFPNEWWLCQCLVSVSVLSSADTSENQKAIIGSNSTIQTHIWYCKIS